MTAPLPDAFSRHEALHMANFLVGAVGLELVDHPAVMANPQWLALATKAMEAPAGERLVCRATPNNARLICYALNRAIPG